MSYIRFYPSNFIGKIPSRFYVFEHTNGKLGFSIRKDKYSFDNGLGEIIHCLKIAEVKELKEIFSEYLQDKKIEKLEKKAEKEKNQHELEKNTVFISMTENTGSS
jgi:hypothetical protein